MTRNVILVSGLILAAAVAAGSSYCSAGSAEARAQARPTDRYFVTVFAYEDGHNNALKTHTFATFVRVPAEANSLVGASRSDVDVRTISWLPAKFGETLKLGIFATKGKNYSLGETLEFARRLKTEVRHWGPYEIDAAMYGDAMKQIARLDSGEVKYKIYNSAQNTLIKTKTKDVSHCIDAVGDVVGALHSGTARGFATGELLMKHFEKHLISPQPIDGLYDLVLQAPEADAALVGRTVQN
ncbi:MAG: hypothetical protein JNL96_28510 [Planctomycetaceae bacterium]|nr:hypothetical protein [Planctomycetaceae bacterium]